MQRIKKAYAENGDLKIIPETPPLDGSENWEQGRGAYFELDNDPNTGDPLALDIDREQDNYFKNVISKNIKHWQENTYPIWFNDISYPKDAIVKYTDGNTYVSKVANNTTLPTNTTNWTIYNPSIFDSKFVKTTGNETIAGTKTFSSNIVGNITGSITGNSATATKLATARTINGVAFDGSANITVSDSTAVKLTENQTITGIKTFSSSPIVPTPTTNTQAANKAYVDTQIDGLGTAATRDVGTAGGNVIEVGAGGWLSQGYAQTTPYGYPTGIMDVTNQTKVIRSDAPDKGISQYSTGIHFSANDTWGRLRVRYDTPSAWIQGGNAANGAGWTSKVVINDDFTGTNVNLNLNGYQKLPSGLIIQWGVCPNNTGTVATRTLPIQFPNNFFNVLLLQSGTTIAPRPFGAAAINNSQFTYLTTSGTELGSYFIAIGY